jgi:hypothetical protein
MILPSRGRKGPDRYYPVKAAILIVGAGLLLAGVRSDTGWLINIAIGLLAVAVILRFLPQKPSSNDADSDPER